MANLQEVFNRIQQHKDELKELKQSFKDGLSNNHEFTKIDEELKTLRARKKQVELTVRESFGGDYGKIEDLAREIQDDKQVVNDIVLNQLMKGEMATVKDEKDNNYEPVISVRFKRFY